MKQINFNNSREQLSADDSQQIYELLCSGLRSENKILLHKRLFNHLGMIPYCGVFERIIKDERTNQWEYCAGQDYPSEIRTVRKIILECK